MDRTVIFGGTFNPFHTGHLEIVHSLLSLEFVKKVIVMPAAVPPHKAAPSLASAEDRLNMCRLALQGLESVSVCDLEIRRGGKSYTYDTVCELLKEVSGPLAIACGADMITTFGSWYRYNDIIKAADIIAYRRKGVKNDAFDNAVAKIRLDGGNVFTVECDITDISSSRIRQGEFEFTPAAVREYITKKGLYGVKK